MKIYLCTSDRRKCASKHFAEMLYVARCGVYGKLCYENNIPITVLYTYFSCAYYTIICLFTNTFI